MVVPFVLVNAFEADTLLVVLSCLALVGFVALIISVMRPALGVFAWVGVALLAISAIIGVAVSETPIVSMLSFVPFGVTVVAFTRAKIGSNAQQTV